MIKVYTNKWVIFVTLSPIKRQIQQLHSIMKKIGIIAIVLCFGFTSQAQNKKWTLKECVEYALANNISVKQSELDLESTDIDKSDAFGNYLPSLNASAFNSWNTGLTQDVTTGILFNQTSRNSSYNLTLGVSIFSGLRNIRSTQRAELSQLAAQYGLKKMQDDISLFVANSFLLVLLNKANLETLEGQNAVTLEQIERTLSLVDAGVLPRGDLLEIQATDASEKQGVVQSENAVRISLISLAQLLLIDDYENFDIEDEGYDIIDEGISSKDIAEIIEAAQQNRAEVKIAEKNLELAEKDLQIARSVYYVLEPGATEISPQLIAAELGGEVEVRAAVTVDVRDGHAIAVVVMGVELFLPRVRDGLVDEGDSGRPEPVFEGEVVDRVAPLPGLALPALPGLQPRRSVGLGRRGDRGCGLRAALRFLSERNRRGGVRLCVQGAEVPHQRLAVAVVQAAVVAADSAAGVHEHEPVAVEERRVGAAGVVTHRELEAVHAESPDPVAFAGQELPVRGVRLVLGGVVREHGGGVVARVDAEADQPQVAPQGIALELALELRHRRGQERTHAGAAAEHEVRDPEPAGEVGAPIGATVLVDQLKFRNRSEQRQLRVVRNPKKLTDDG